MIDILKAGNDLHFRKLSDHWQRRLMDGNKFTEKRIIEFHNGYKKDSPRIQYEVKSFYHHEGHYIIRLGKVINTSPAADKLASDILDAMLMDSIKLIN